MLFAGLTPFQFLLGVLYPFVAEDGNPPASRGRADKEGYRCILRNVTLNVSKRIASAARLFQYHVPPLWKHMSETGQIHDIRGTYEQRI